MFAQALRHTVLRRSGLACVRAAGVRRSPARCPAGKRCNSTATRPVDPQASPLAAGIAGSLVTLLGGYIWYHVSGTKKTIDSVKGTIEAVESLQTKFPEIPLSSSSALPFIRSTIHRYSFLLPDDAADALDLPFEEADLIFYEHGEDVDRILRETCNELKDVLQDRPLTRDSAQKASEIVRRKGGELKEISRVVGQQILDKNPELREKVEPSINQLRDLGKQYGPNAQKIVDETYEQIQKFANKELTSASINSVASLIKSKTEEVKQLGSRLSDKVWEEASKEAQTYLEMPCVKKVLDEYKDSLKSVAIGGGAPTSIIPEVFIHIKTLDTESSDEGIAQRLREFLEEKIREGKKRVEEASFGAEMNWHNTIQTLEKYIKTIPGGEELLKETPDLSDLFNLAKKKGPEAERIAKEAFQEISSILTKKMGEAKELTQDAKEMKQSAKK